LAKAKVKADPDYWHNFKRKNPETYRAQSRAARLKTFDKTWLEFFDAYGHQCVTCGETDKSTLTVGHLNGDGGEHRREISEGKGGDKFLRQLRKLKWLKDKGIATQCASCQMRERRPRWTDPSHPFFSN